jgi:hypothetical protein
MASKRPCAAGEVRPSAWRAPSWLSREPKAVFISCACRERRVLRRQTGYRIIGRFDIRQDILLRAPGLRNGGFGLLNRTLVVATSFCKSELCASASPT